MMLAKDDLAVVGEIILSWGQAEAAIGNALASLWRAPNAEVRTIIHEMGYKAKVERLKRIAKDDAHGALMNAAAKELSWTLEHWRGERDTLAHGSVTYGLEDGSAAELITDYLRMKPLIRAVAKPRQLLPADLERTRLRADYVALLGMIVWAVAADTPSEHTPDLPARPA